MICHLLMIELALPFNENTATNNFANRFMFFPVEFNVYFNRKLHSCLFSYSDAFRNCLIYGIITA